MILWTIFDLAVGGFALYGLLTAAKQFFVRVDGWFAMRSIRRDRELPDWMRQDIALCNAGRRVAPTHPVFRSAAPQRPAGVVVPLTRKER